MAKKAELSELATALAEEIRQDRRNVSQRAEAVLREVVEQDRDFTFDELQFFTAEAGYDKRKLAQERRRMARVVRLQAIAGTSDERTKLEKSLTAAQADLKKRGPEVQAQIDKLTAELRGLEKSVDSLSRRKSEVDQALLNLTECVCPATSAAAAVKRSQVKTTLGREASDLKTDIQQIETLLMERTDDTNYWLAVRLYDPELIHEGTVGSVIKRQFSPKWTAVKPSLVAELPTMKARLAELESRLAEELADCESVLQQYWR